jgi:hypothetical protein
MIEEAHGNINAAEEADFQTVLPFYSSPAVERSKMESR